MRAGHLSICVSEICTNIIIIHMEELYFILAFKKVCYNHYAVKPALRGHLWDKEKESVKDW
jgi:hypothetical protein